MQEMVNDTQKFTDAFDDIWTRMLLDANSTGLGNAVIVLNFCIIIVPMADDRNEGINLKLWWISLLFTIIIISTQ